MSTQELLKKWEDALTQALSNRAQEVSDKELKDSEETLQVKSGIRAGGGKYTARFCW